MKNTKKLKTSKGHQGTKYYTGSSPIPKIPAPIIVIILFLITLGYDRVSCWTGGRDSFELCGLSYAWLMLFPLFVVMFLVSIIYEIIKVRLRK